MLRSSNTLIKNVVEEALDIAQSLGFPDCQESSSAGWKEGTGTSLLEPNSWKKLLPASPQLVPDMTWGT